MSGQGTAFLYGTLMAPEVFFSVCYGEKNPPKAIRDLHTFTPAILRDYSRHRVQEADYPAIVAETGHTVRGVYATGLTDANLSKLDYFEGVEYERVTVKIQTVAVATDGGKEVLSEEKTACVYVFLHPDQLERREWDFEEFRRDKMHIWSRGDWAFDDNDKAAVRTAA